MAKFLTDYKNIVTGSGKSYKQVVAKSDGRILWKSGAIVTYMVDTASAYTEEVDSGDSVLNPTTFTPSKDGWTFVGWREDTAANSDVLTNKVMDSEPIILYAVFKQTDTVTFVSYDKSEVITGTRYYNASGAVYHPVITAPTGNSYPGWTWRGWSYADDWRADAAVNFDNGFSWSDDGVAHTRYGLYQQEIYWDFVSGGLYEPPYTHTVTGTRYYNASGNTKNAEMTIPEISGESMDGWTWVGWDHYIDDEIDPSEFICVVGDYSSPGFTFTDVDWSQIIYGMYMQRVTLYYNGNGATGGSVSSDIKFRYYDSSDMMYDPSFILAENEFTRTNYEFTGWNLGAVGDIITLDADAYAYAQWKVLAIPYTVNFAEYPMSMTGSGEDDGTAGIYSYNDCYVVQVAKDENSIAYGWVTGSVTYPTRNCNKVRVTCTYDDCLPVINGVEPDGYAGEDNYVYLDCSGDTFTLTVELSNPSDGITSIYIKEVYFYYE